MTSGRASRLGRWSFLGLASALVASACGSAGSGGAGGDAGTNPSCLGKQSCDSSSDCPALSCKCPGSKLTANIRACKSGCCAATCAEACGSSVGGSGGASGGTGGASGGTGGASGGTGGASGGTGGASGGTGGASGGTGGASGGTGGASGGTGGASGGTGGASGGSGGTDGGAGDGGTVPADADVHVLFFDAGAPAGSYWGILRHGVKAKGSTSFSVDDVDTGFNTSQFSTYALVEMVLDASGYPHVAYSHFRTKELRYRRWNGTAWVKMGGAAGYDVLDTDVDITGVAKHFLVIRNGKPELAFRQNTNLKRYSWDGAQWSGSVVFGVNPPSGIANPGGAPALAFDSQGYAHIAHHDHGSYKLHYARQSSSGWTNEHLTISPQMSILYKLIALDAADRPHIVYNFGYTRWNGSSWVKADGTAGYDAYDTGFISAGLTPQGELLMGHKAGAALSLARKALGATAWTNAGQVHPGPFSGAAFTSDAAGTPHAVVSEGPTDANTLVHLVQTPSGWVSEKVYTHTGLCRLVHPSIAVK